MSQPADADTAHAGSASGALFSRAWPDDALSAATAKATWPKTVRRPTTPTANMFGHRSAPTKRFVDGPTARPSHHRMPPGYGSSSLRAVLTPRCWGFDTQTYVAH
jgi:hypothetical protein